MRCALAFLGGKEETSRNSKEEMWKLQAPLRKLQALDKTGENTKKRSDNNSDKTG